MKSIFLTPQENTQVYVEEDTQYVVVFGDAQFPKDTQKIYFIDLVFNKPGTSAELIVLYKLKKDQHLNLTTVATHKVPNTTCFQNVRGVLFSESESEYVGKILIEKPAQQTSSFLDHKVLVLGNETKNNSQPILEIEADDVKASHGSTTGRVNPETVYYLMSRGLTHEESEGLIIEGFFEGLLNKIVDEGVRKRVRNSL